MSISMEKFDLFMEASKNQPTISTLKLDVKIEQFLNGTIPKLTSDEMVRVDNYLPHPVWSKFNILTDDVRDEINRNIVLITSVDQRQRYLNYLLSKLDPVVAYLENATWFEEADTISNIYPGSRVLNFTRDQLHTYRMLNGLLSRSNRYYYVMYVSVREEITSSLSQLLTVEVVEPKIHRIESRQYSLKVYALVHYYLAKKNEGSAINAKNMNEIAKSYGYDSPSSGIALMNKFGAYKDPEKRTKITHNKRADNKIHDIFKGVITMLTQQNCLHALTMAKNEYSVFCKKYEAFY